MVRDIDETIAAVETELAGLSAKKRDAVLAKLRHARQEVASNMGYVAEAFEEHMKTVTEHAKLEVNGYVQTAIQCAGIETLGGSPVLQLGAGPVRVDEGAVG